MHRYMEEKECDLSSTNLYRFRSITFAHKVKGAFLFLLVFKKKERLPAEFSGEI